jgi:hypothetical protein
MGIATISRGNSDTAHYLRSMGQQRAQHLRQSNVFGNQGVVSELVALYEECRMDNWDGDGAIAIAPATVSHAFGFLAVLPLGMEKPSLGVEPDGHITLEWYRHPRWIASISVGPEGMLYYAGLFGTSKVNGSEPFFPDNNIPTNVLDLIQRIIILPNVQS